MHCQTRISGLLSSGKDAPFSAFENVVTRDFQKMPSERKNTREAFFESKCKEKHASVVPPIFRAGIDRFV